MIYVWVAAYLMIGAFFYEFFDDGSLVIGWPFLFVILAFTLIVGLICFPGIWLARKLRAGTETVK